MPREIALSVNGKSVAGTLDDPDYATRPYGTNHLEVVLTDEAAFAAPPSLDGFEGTWRLTPLADGTLVKVPGSGHTDAVLRSLLALSGILFALAVAGVFINRKNVILLLMCVELLLLAANFNFIAFSRYLGDISGQVFVFFVLTVAAAESAIGLAILVVLFRERRTINVEDLDTLKG